MQRRLVMAATALVAVLAVVLVAQLREEETQNSTGQTAAAARCGLSLAPGDFDGDRRRDVASVYAAISPGTPCDFDHVSGRFTLRVQLAAGVTSDLQLGTLSGKTARPRPCLELCVAIAAPDVDGDGRSEVAVELGQGASESWFALFRLGQDRIEPFVVESRDGSRLAEFRLFGSLGHGGDFVCRTAKGGAPLVVQSSYGLTAQDKIVFGETVYAVDGSVLRPLATHEETRAVHSRYPPKVQGRRCLVPDERLVGTDPRQT